MFPQSGNDVALVVSGFVEALFEKIVCKASGLGKAVHAAAPSTIHPLIRCDYFLWDVAKRYIGKLRLFERCHDVEIGKIDTHELFAQCGNDTVDEYFDEDGHGCVVSNVF